MIPRNWSPLAAAAFLPALLLLSGSGCAPDDRANREASPATELLERVEAETIEREGELRSKNLEHFALLAPVEETDIANWLAPIAARRDGGAVVLAVGDTPELHGGAILDFLFRHWRPQAREARPNDRYPFRNEAVPLGHVYAGHLLQIFLPVAGRSADAIRGEVPDSPTLARMRFFTETDGVPVVERDAYSFLHLLIAREGDFTASWSNQVGQELSVDLLMQHAWRHYLRGRSAVDERDEHSNLHMVELLLAYRYRAETRSDGAGDLDPNEIKRSFLANELARPAADSDDESLAHYTESLGWLVAEPDVSWSEAEERQVRDWLEWLSTERFSDLDAVEAPHLAHLQNGLHLVGAHEERLAIR